MIFLTRFVQKGFLWSKKQRKWTPHIFYIIPLIQISLVRNISSNWQFWFFELNLPKMVFPVKNRKCEHRDGILHIWISIGTKFQLKLIILSFWTKFTQKRYFQLKTEQAVQGLQPFAFCVVNVNSTVAFKHFEDLKDLKILNISKVKMISKVMIKFRSKFQFQIPLQFYRTVVLVIVKSVDKYHHLFNLPIFYQKGYSVGIIAWNINISLPCFLTTLSNLAFLQLPN